MHNIYKDCAHLQELSSSLYVLPIFLAISISVPKYIVILSANSGVNSGNLPPQSGAPPPLRHQSDIPNDILPHSSEARSKPSMSRPLLRANRPNQNFDTLFLNPPLFCCSYSLHCIYYYPPESNGKSNGE